MHLTYRRATDGWDVDDCKLPRARVEEGLDADAVGGEEVLDIGLVVLGHEVLQVPYVEEVRCAEAEQEDGVG